MLYTYKITVANRRTGEIREIFKEHEDPNIHMGTHEKEDNDPYFYLYYFLSLKKEEINKLLEIKDNENILTIMLQD